MIFNVCDTQETARNVGVILTISTAKALMKIYHCSLFQYHLPFYESIPEQTGNIMTTSKLLFAPCLLFAIIIVGWSTSLMSNEPNIRALENQISNLRRELVGYEEMKDHHMRDEIELSWDQQHLRELHEQEEAVIRNVERMTETHEKKTRHLRSNHEEMNRAILSTQENNDRMRQQDSEMLTRLGKEATRAEEKALEEHEFNLVLNDILDEMRYLLNVQEQNGE
jgi:hypothetical protein